MDQKTFREIASLLKKYDYFLITSTAEADGDSIGAQLALKAILKTQVKGNKDKIIEIINENRCPEKYRFLPESHTVKRALENKRKKFEVAFILDGGMERVGSVYPLVKNCKVKVLIDHHKFGSKERYEISLYNPKASSTSELVYQFLESKYWQVKLTPQIAASLYLGIIFDTGFFTYSLTSPQTHLIASHLIATGINFSEIAQKGIREKTFPAQILLSKVLSRSKRDNTGKIISSVISKEMMQQSGANSEDQEGIIEQLFNIRKVEVAVLFKEEQKSNYKLSFRSNGLIDVGRLCRELAGDEGGGHARAAGCLLKAAKRETIINRVISKLEKQLCDKESRLQL